MIIALYALAFAMIAGGLFAALLGWDIVLVERGWTMVISGIIGASSGALLIGITLIVARLTRIQEELSRVQLSLDEDIEAVVVPTPAEQARTRMTDDVASAATGAAAVAAATGGLFGLRGAATPEANEEPVLADRTAYDSRADEAESDALPDADEEVQVPFELRAVGREELADAVPHPEPDVETQAQVPDFLFAERYRETVVTETIFPERDLPAATEPEAESGESGPGDIADHGEVFEPEHDETAKSEIPESETAESEVEPFANENEAPVVIGTYNSGDNKYVMFSDGSIEAETPQGFFRFSSLDELKEFIAAGGEGGGSTLT